MESELNIKKSTVLLAIQMTVTILVMELIGALLIVTLLTGISILEVALDTLLIIGLIIAVKFIATTYLVVSLAVNWLANRYFIRGNHLILRHRMISEDERLYELSNLRSIRTHQSWFGRRLNYGTIKLRFGVPGYSREIVLNDVYEPRRYELMLENYFQEVAPPPATVPRYTADMAT